MVKIDSYFTSKGMKYEFDILTARILSQFL